MRYISTRGGDEAKNFFDAVLQGLARDGGLYVPESLPDLSDLLPTLVGKGYKEVAKEVLSRLIEEASKDEIAQCVENAYSKARWEDIIAITSTSEAEILELYHGPTAAFKDFALQLLPQFVRLAKEKQERKETSLILAATSGDTGKAAMEGFADVEGTEVIVFYPTEGVSAMQRQQMITQEGKNTTAVGIRGNFDDAQAACKMLFGDEKLRESLREKNFVFSSANSMNVGRLFPQIVYYVWGYLALVSQGTIVYGDRLNVVVPTGNFGNLLAGFYAKDMGLPLGRMICASNANDVLTQVIQTRVYDKRRPFHKTLSPSMDILVSSNFERYLYRMAKDPKAVRQWMEALQGEGIYTLPEGVLGDDLVGFFASDEEALAMVRQVFEKDGVLVDPHTAVGLVCLQKDGEDHGKGPTMVLSTASPYKFAAAVAKGLELFEGDEEVLLKEMEKTSHQPMPRPLQGLFHRPITQSLVIDPEDIRTFVLEKIGGGK